MEFKEHIQEYIKAIKSIDVNNANEHTYRTALENLVNSLQFKAKHITAVQEAKDETLDIDGTPDFFVYEDYNQLFKSLIGFIECKKISYPLSKLKDTQQIKKYSKTSQNIILTNYKEFILLQEGKIKTNIILLDDNFAESKNPNKEQDLINLLRDFYSYDYPYIKTKKALVSALAMQSFYYSVELRKFISDAQNLNHTFYFKFNSLFAEFQKTLNYVYDLADFCDIYAQSFVYGLLFARIEKFEKNDKNDRFDEKDLNFLSDLPDEYKLLFEFLDAGYTYKYLPQSIKLAIVNITKNINLIDIGTINNEFLKEGKGKTGIAVYLYEDFLKEYDKLKGTENRKESGVYYTPKEVTHFITKSVQEIIKDKFGKKGGFLDKNVKVLDFACGTGTFIDSVYDLMIDKHASPIEKQKTKEKIINDIYGFELLFPPYIVAHTILTKYLKDNGVKINQNERLPIYLTNTLDLSAENPSGYLPNLMQENQTAHKVKRETDILAIIGNPPYFNGKSKSASKEIDEFTKDYKKDLNEKKINLDDLYIKFIRFAEWKIAKSGYGIVGIITNNSFLDGVTHRQMRKHLIETFDEIYILNLHGNTRKGETDKNIFDIMVGVSISIFVKCQNHTSEKKVYYYSTLAENITSRAEKLNLLETKTLKTIKWEELSPAETAKYFFVEKDLEQEQEYNKFLKITNIFDNINTSVKTDRDELVINYDKDKLKANLEIAFSGNYDITFIEKYNITNSSSYSFKDKLKEQDFDKNSIFPIQYRPLDIRNIYYKIGFTSRPGKMVIPSFVNNDNIGICFERNKIRDSFHHVFVSQQMICHDLFFVSSYCAPLYLYNPNIEKRGTETKTPNFTEKLYKEYLNVLSFKPTTEDILNYIYSVLHSPIYRQKYIEFLKTDFPAVPMTKDKDTFYSYAKLGKQLIALHTMADIPKDKEIREEYEGEIANFVIAKITVPTKAAPKLTIKTTDNKEIIFNGVTPEIYAFQIGSYNPIDKWLKYRIKDKVILGIDDLAHIKNMIIVIKHTMLIMEQIKELKESYLKDI